MKVFSVTIQDDKEHMFMELLNSVSFVKKIEAIPDDENIPQWHKAILDQRLQSESEDYLDWETVQTEIDANMV